MSSTDKTSRKHSAILASSQNTSMTQSKDFWRWQTMNPDGYRHDIADNASKMGKTNGIATSVIINGAQVNGH